jgi:IS30 family transposase
VVDDVCRGRGSKMSRGEREWIASLFADGMTYNEVRDASGRSIGSVSRVLKASGGLRPARRARSGDGVGARAEWSRSARRLSLAAREEISRGLTSGLTFTAIAAGIGRSVSTVSREVNNNGGRARYRAWVAHRWACDRARRPKPAKLAVNVGLSLLVDEWMSERLWSPRQVSARLHLEHPDDPMMRVSHETIYQSIYVQGRGALRKELAACLRTGRAVRRSRTRNAGGTVGRIADMINISERPAEADDRAVPGHWEGDLIIGRNGKSAVGTLVERSTRFVMLLHLANDRTATTVRDAMTAAMKTLPERLLKSVTWDQGVEMSQHARFTIDTGIDVYFCDPHSPWQRGSNENTNGLLRQFMPKGTDLSLITPAGLRHISDLMNGRPRQTLGWMTPSEKLTELLATTA